MHYFLDGKDVSPEKISSCAFQLNEIESMEGYNSEVTALGLRVQISSHEAPYKATFLIKVVPETTSDTKLPEEKIIGILNDRVHLHK